MKTLTLADGRKIDLKTKAVVEEKKEEASEETQALPSITPKPREGVKLEDLPTAPKQMNVINAVIGYKLLGISDADIVYALGCTDEQLFQIVQSEAYNKCWDLVIESFIKGQTQTAKDIIASGAVQAATDLVSIARNSRNEKVKLSAIDSVLNRVGISEANADNPMAQGLVIKVMKDTQTSNVEIKING